MARGSRLVSGANAAVAFGLVAVLAAVALVVQPPAPPGIAEFAPQASKPITKAPAGQAAQSGAGPGGAGFCAEDGPCPAGSAAPTPLPSVPGVSVDPGVVGAPSSLACYTWPDGSVTQTFDPQSPPCVASWPDAAKGNGGATTRGVTGSEIRLAVPVLTRENEAEATALAQFFNTRFQLYGRTIRPVFFPDLRPDSGPSERRASALAAASLDPFAALQLYSSTELTSYERPLMDAGIITLRDQTIEETHYPQSPLLWTYYPQFDALLRNAAFFLCRSLPPGATAAYAGGAEARKPRKFGILVRTDEHGWTGGDYAPLVDGLRACGDHPEIMSVQVGATDELTQTQAAMVTMRDRGVTSVVVNRYMGRAMRSASHIGYQPEWVRPSTWPRDEGAESDRPEQNAHSLGIVPWEKPVVAADSPADRAYREIKPNTPATSSCQVPGACVDDALYHQLLLIASGVQAAGPRLTVPAFDEGLRGLEFPNPGAAQPPYFQPSVGFDDTRAMTRDFAVWFWSPTHTAPDYRAGQQPGAYCYVHGGQRWRLGTWPDKPLPLFQAGSRC